MKAVFIAGTDTGVGKTIVAGLLSRYLSEKGYRVVTQKWVETGHGNFPSDIDAHLKFTGRTKRDFRRFYPSMVPYAFKFASSPHLASRLEGKRINKLKIKKCLKVLSEHFDYVIIEGTGGLLVPLNKKDLLVDFIKEFDLPVLIVAGNRLGVINHALLSMEALKTRGMRVLGVIFNNISKGQNRLIMEDNPEIIKQFSKVDVFGVLPRVNNPYQLQKRFMPLGDKVFNQLWKS